jgi:hypothetical protein
MDGVNESSTAVNQLEPAIAGFSGNNGDNDTPLVGPPPAPGGSKERSAKEAWDFETVLGQWQDDGGALGPGD